MLDLLRPLVKPALRLLFEEFMLTLQRPRQAQDRLLQKLVSDLAATEYGRSLGVKAGDGRDEFRRRVPLVNYDDLSDWVERQKRHEGAVLVGEPVLFYEKTSGSSGAAKYIPYTRSLKNSFNRMFLVWLYDLLANGPRLRSGKTFISVSPAFRQKERTARGLRVGLDDDSEYLNGWAQLLLKPFFVLPPAVRALQDPAEFKRAVAALLVAEERLEVISVWNPSFLEILLDHIRADREVLVDDLQRGAVELEGMSLRFVRPGAERLALVKADPPDWRLIWPQLKLISCWTSAQAEAAAARVRALFPATLLQGKGLLATEAPMTLPLLAARGFVPLPGEIFYEFLDEAGRLSLLHELEAGREYEIVVTQSGGLSRYRVGDRVRVTHFYQAVPCLEFIGRGDAVCDLAGEKLNERFVQDCLPRLSASFDFHLVIPVAPVVDIDDDRPRYLLLVDRLAGNPSDLEEEIEALFREAYHYRNARLLGQLGAVRVVVAADARALYYDYFMGRGMKLGDIKERVLLTNVAAASGFLKKMRAAPASG